jgi:hypothetical protein
MGGVEGPGVEMPEGAEEAEFGGRAGDLVAKGSERLGWSLAAEGLVMV